jgi:hypothetical protein
MGLGRYPYPELFDSTFLRKFSHSDILVLETVPCLVHIELFGYLVAPYRPGPWYLLK